MGGKRLTGVMAVAAAFLFVFGLSAACWAQDIEMPTESVAEAKLVTPVRV